MGSALTALVATIGAIAIWVTAGLVAEIIDLSHIQLPAVRAMTLADMMHDGIRAVVYRAIYVGKGGEPALKDEVRTELDTFVTSLRQHLAEIEKLDVRPETRREIVSATPAVDDYCAVAGEILKAALAGNTEEVARRLPVMDSAFTGLEERLEALGELIERDAEATARVGDVLATRAYWINGILIVVGLFAGLGLSTLARHAIVRPLAEQSRDLVRSTERLALAGADLATVSRTLASTSSNQTAEAAESAAAAAEIESMIAATSTETGHLTSIAAAATASTRKGNDSVSEMKAAVQEISTAVTALQKQVESTLSRSETLSVVIREIAAQTNEISGIVFRTKLLAFNASVAAARAGAAGKGFSIIADEVALLAQLIGSAATNITARVTVGVKTVDQFSTEAATEMRRVIDEAMKRAAKGEDVTARCGSAFAEIKDSVASIEHIVQNVSEALGQQHKASQSIRDATARISTGTETTSTIATQTAGAASTIAAETGGLDQLVASLGMMVGNLTPSRGREGHEDPPVAASSRAGDRGPLADRQAA